MMADRLALARIVLTAGLLGELCQIPVGAQAPRLEPLIVEILPGAELVLHAVGDVPIQTNLVECADNVVEIETGFSDDGADFLIKVRAYSPIATLPGIAVRVRSDLPGFIWADGETNVDGQFAVSWNVEQLLEEFADEPIALTVIAFDLESEECAVGLTVETGPGEPPVSGTTLDVTR